MSFSTVRRDIETRFKDNWAVTTVAYDNIAFSPPDQKGKEYWVRLRIFEDQANRINIGQPMVERVTGTIIATIQAPPNVGTNTIRDYAATIAEIFRDKTFNGITCTEAVPDNVGEIDGWYVYRVSWGFRYDGVHATT